jgi:hypothetical protein
MQAIPEYNDVSERYEGCTEAWAREFDPVVEKLVSQAIGRQCYGEKNIRDKNITEFTIEEFGAIVADVVLRTLLYAGWRDLLKIRTDVMNEIQDIRTLVQSGSIVRDAALEPHTKNQHCPQRDRSQDDATPQ